MLANKLKINVFRGLEEDYLIFLIYFNAVLILLRAVEKYIFSADSDVIYFAGVILNGVLWVPAYFRSKINAAFFVFIAAIAALTDSLYDFALDFKWFFILIGYLNVMESRDLDIARLKKHAQKVLNFAVGYLMIEVAVRLYDLPYYLSLKDTFLTNYYTATTLGSESRNMLVAWAQVQGINLDGHSSALLLALFYLQNTNAILKIVTVGLLYMSNVKTWWLGFVTINTVYFIDYLQSIRNTLLGVSIKVISTMLTLTVMTAVVAFTYHVKKYAIDLNIEVWRSHWWELISFAAVPHGFSREWFHLHSLNNHLSEFILTELADKISWFGVATYIYITCRHVRGIYLVVLFFAFLHTPHLLWPSTAVLFAVFNRAHREELKARRNVIYEIVFKKQDSKLAAAGSA